MAVNASSVAGTAAYRPSVAEVPTSSGLSPPDGAVF